MNLNGTNLSELSNNTCLEEEYNRDLISFVDFWVCGVATLVTTCFGILGNFCSILVLCQKNMKSIFNHLLASLCTADMGFLLCSFILTQRSLGTFSQQHGIVLKNFFLVAECLCHISLAGSIFITAVFHPHWYQVRTMTEGHRRTLAIYLLPTIFLAIFLNIPRFITYSDFFRKLQSENNMTYISFLLIYQIIHPLTTAGLAPLLLLSGLNIRLVFRKKGYTHQSSSTDIKLAKIVGTVVFVFLTLNMPRVVIGIFEFSRFDRILNCYKTGTGKIKYMAPNWQILLDLLARFLAVVNSSCNFCLYCVMNRQFRAEFLKIFGRCKRQYSGHGGISLAPPPGSPTLATSRTNLQTSSPGTVPEPVTVINTGNKYLETCF